MKVRACVYVNPLWGVPFIKALEHSLIELGVTDHVDICLSERFYGTALYSDVTYDMTFFVCGRKLVSAKGWDDKIKILLQVEQLTTCRANGEYIETKGFDYIFEWFKENTKLKNTKNVIYCPFGYSPVFERPKKGLKKDIDVFSWGVMQPGRIKFLEYLKDNGINVFYSKKTISDADLYDYIERSKMSIWIKHKKAPDYSQIHCIPAAAQKEFYMIEKSNNYDKFTPGEDFMVVADRVDALEKIRYYLKNEDERNELAEKYYKSVVKKTYTSSVENALRRIL